MPLYLAYVGALQRVDPALGIDPVAKAELEQQGLERIGFAVVALQSHDGVPVGSLPRARREPAFAQVVATLDDTSLLPPQHPAMPAVYVAIAEALAREEGFPYALQVLERVSQRWPATPLGPEIARRKESLREAIRIRTPAPPPPGQSP
ncbi:MAG: hypothetical protein JST00_29055 [Deltaproteobacteria bacterium]|nr:hypothetical protein [Deltaproteobacteria bacterium]